MPLEGCGKSSQNRNKDPIFSSQFTGTKILVVKLHTEAIDEAQELSSVGLIASTLYNKVRKPFNYQIAKFCGKALAKRELLTLNSKMLRTLH
jgi:hypothetical protein